MSSAGIYGVLLLSSGRAALLAYTMPIWSTLLSVPVLGEALTRQRLLALALGLAGIVVLMGGSLTSFFSTLPGYVAMILAAWAWALGIVLMIVAVLGSVVLGVIGALKAANGQPYSYPWKLNVLH